MEMGTALENLLAYFARALGSIGLVGAVAGGATVPILALRFANNGTGGDHGATARWI